MDFNDIAPPAVEIHQVSLMIESLSTPLHQEEKNIENTENEPISLTLTANNYMTKCSKVSPHLLRRIISEIGLDQFILSERSAWNCLMDYFGVFGYFHYDLIMHRREYIAQQISSHFGMNCTQNLSGMYDVEFTTYDSTRNMNLKSLKVAMSWEQQSLIKSKQTKRVEGPYRVILEYNGQKLEYIEQATEKNSLLTNERYSNSSNSTNIYVNSIYIHTSEILFNDEVIFKCTFPSYYESVAFKNYSPGMRIEIEQRHESHPSIKFAQTILEEVFGYEFNNTLNRSNSGSNKTVSINNDSSINEMTVEEVWTSFMELHGFRGLCSLFSFFKPLENEFLAMNFMKLAKEKDYAVILSDIFIKTSVV